MEARFNSEFIILKRLAEQKAPIMLELIEANVEGLLGQEWYQLEGSVEILQPFDEATTQLSSETLPALSILIPVLKGLNHGLEKIISKKKTGANFARQVVKTLKARFPDFSDDCIDNCCLTHNIRLQ